MSIVPYVIEPHKDSERVYDLYSRMLKDRIVFIKGTISQETADSVVAQLLFLETQDNETDIQMYINSPGGNISAMFAIYDTMNYIKPNVVTFCYGEAASAAAFLLSSGHKRYALSNSTIMIHELHTGFEGKWKDIDNLHEKVKKLHDKLNRLLAKNTGQPLEKIEIDTKLDYFMDAEEALDYGIIDEIQERRS